MFSKDSSKKYKKKKCRNCVPTLPNTAFPSLFWILRENAAENSWPEDEILKFQIQEGIMSPLMTKKCMGTCSIWCVVPPGNGVFPRVESCVTLYSVCASRVSTNQSVSRVSRDGTGRGTPKHLQNLGIPLCPHFANPTLDLSSAHTKA